MKTLTLILCLLCGGCVAPQPTSSNTFVAAPMPPAPPGVPPMPVVKKQVKTLSSPKAAAMFSAPMAAASAAEFSPPPPPSWTFGNLSGDYQIDVSTNLTDWWPILVVYSTTNLTITSDTVSKRPMLFFRVRPTN